MNTKEMFGDKAKWVSLPHSGGVPMVRKEFDAEKPQKAILTVCGLGFFDVFINGNRIGNDYLKPVFSDYADRDFGHMGYPLPDKTSHRIYVNCFDVSEYVNDGKNAIVFLIAPGWYAQQNRHAEGDAKFSDKLLLCFSLQIEGKDKNTEVYSDESLKYDLSHIYYWNIYMGVKIDFAKRRDYAYLAGYDDSNWPSVSPEKNPEAPLYLYDCPNDTITDVITPRVIAKIGRHTLYDAGKNVSGWAVFKGKGNVKISYAEELKNGIFLDYDYSGGIHQKQIDRFYHVKYDSDVRPYFRWNGFRYFRIDGSVSDVKVEVLHLPFEECSTFNSDNEVLNKLFDAYKLTELNNMHAGVPSDCPHRERLGYTGDGLLTTETALLCFNAESFYRKWIEDICDCQDINTGHVQHTAPFMGGGGGPCGWGGAIVIVPYKYYLMTGDIEFVRHTIPNMEKWFDFIIQKTFGEGKEYGLVVRECPKGWCLGDWCTLEKIAIPEPFVNTYYLIKCLEEYKVLCDALGLDAKHQELIPVCKKAMEEKYKGSNGLYCNSIQGADFFACDLGLISFDKLYLEIQNYRKLRRFDTGIFGTDVMLKVLSEHGENDLVCELLSSENLGSFGYMFNHGATTLWEYWTIRKSHDHPMFGSVIKYLFTSIAGINYDVGFKKIVIDPTLFPKMLGRLHVSLDKCGVDVAVDYRRRGEVLELTVESAPNANVFVKVCGELIPLWLESKGNKKIGVFKL